jgi:hypothetical protein
VIKFREIFRSFRPLVTWRSRSEEVDERQKQDPRADSSLSGQPMRERSLVLPGLRRRERLEWHPVEDSQLVERVFQHLRDHLYDLNRRSKRNVGTPPRYLWESGNLAGMRPYVFLQPWNDRGYLIETAPKGWIVSRADKIASQSQFVRDRMAWDRVTVYQALGQPALLRIASEAMGESMVSLVLYEDFMARQLLPK